MGNSTFCFPLHIENLFYLDNTLSYCNGASHRLDQQSLKDAQASLQVQQENKQLREHWGSWGNKTHLFPRGHSYSAYLTHFLQTTSFIISAFCLVHVQTDGIDRRTQKFRYVHKWLPLACAQQNPLIGGKRRHMHVSNRRHLHVQKALPCTCE